MRGAPWCLLYSLIFGIPLFEIGEFKLMLSNWLIFLHTHVQSRFHVFLMICKRGVGYLPFSLCAQELRMCLTFDKVIRRQPSQGIRRQPSQL